VPSTDKQPLHHYFELTLDLTSFHVFDQRFHSNEDSLYPLLVPAPAQVHFANVHHTASVVQLKYNKILISFTWFHTSPRYTNALLCIINAIMCFVIEWVYMFHAMNKMQTRVHVRVHLIS